MICVLEGNELGQKVKALLSYYVLNFLEPFPQKAEWLDQVLLMGKINFALAPTKKIACFSMLSSLENDLWRGENSLLCKSTNGRGILGLLS